MDLLVTLYQETTDPKLKWSVFFGGGIQSKIILSIVIHVFLYVMGLNLFVVSLYGRMLTKRQNARFCIILVIVMWVGYIGRLAHVKSIARVYQNPTAFINQHYNSWIFLG
jgi:fumarate reductase subunit D